MAKILLNEIFSESSKQFDWSRRGTKIDRLLFNIFEHTQYLVEENFKNFTWKATETLRRRCRHLDSVLLFGVLDGLFLRAQIIKIKGSSKQ